MSGAEFALLGVAWVLAGASPGPATLAISGTSMRYGRPAGLALAWGVIAGSATWGLAAALGLGAIMLAQAWIAETLRILAACYLIWLGIQSLRNAIAPKPAATADIPTRQFFVRGLLIHLTNPKAILSWGAVFSVAVPPTAPLSDLVFVGLGLMTLSVLLFTSYALVFSVPAAGRIYRRIGRWIEGAFGVLFGAAGLRLLAARP